MRHVSRQDREGWVRIEGFVRDKDLCVRIIDSGIGMDAGKLGAIQAHLVADSEQDEEKRHVGLKNIYDRVRLYYGEGYGLTLVSEPGKGTTITAELPLELE